MKIFKKFLIVIKPYFELNIKTLLLRIGILVLCMGLILTIDLTLKQYLYTFDEYQLGGQNIDWKIIGFRPLLNNGAAFSSLLGQYTLLQTIGLIVFLIIFMMIFTKVPIRFMIFLGLIAAGALGNVIDRFVYDGYVRDMIYFPWWTSFATFNFADSSVVVGTVVLIILIIIDLFKKDRPEEKPVGKVV